MNEDLDAVYNSNAIVLANAIELICDAMMDLNGEMIMIGNSGADMSQLRAAAAAHLRNELVKNAEVPANVI